jgi:hypothetical protein
VQVDPVDDAAIAAGGSALLHDCGIC